MKPLFSRNKFRFSLSGSCVSWHKFLILRGRKSVAPFFKKCVVKSKLLTSLVLILGLVLSMFILCYMLFSVFHHFYFGSTLSVNLSKGFQRYDDEVASEKRLRTTHERLLTLSWKKSQIHNQYGSSALWDEPYKRALFWRPCANKHKEISKDDVTFGTSTKQNGFILVSASGGLNQQRVAVCNAVAVAYLLNATLVLPRFLYSSVWRDVRWCFIP